MRFALPGIPAEAVYDVLHALTAAGLVQIQPLGSVALRVQGRRLLYRASCRSCGNLS